MNNDLISKSHFDKRVREAVGMTIAELTADFKDGVRTTLELLKTEQTVDAVPVVQCKDCKYWDKKDDAPYGYCMAMKHGFVSSHWEIGIYRTYKGDFYCADGKRQEDDE